jgi:NAD(P)-dependent dehydrogenase (short-subunit alcohol dehydrogenase family)
MRPFCSRKRATDPESHDAIVSNFYHCDDIDMNLTGKKIAVTGASGALGTAIVKGVRAAGGAVAAIDRHSAAEELRSLSGVELLGGFDLSKPEDATNAIREATARLGGLDGLVNVAGTFRWETIEAGSAETWDLLYRVNLTTVVNASRAAVPILVKSGAGRIVNIGAAGALKASAGMGAYAASKAGVIKLTEALAEETKDRNVTVNAVLPSIIDTPTNRAEMPTAKFESWVRAEQIADLIVFLLSDRASAITGAAIPIVGRV